MAQRKERKSSDLSRLEPKAIEQHFVTLKRRYGEDLEIQDMLEAMMTVFKYVRLLEDRIAYLERGHRSTGGFIAEYE